eukprot:CAMPEP_0171469768 /NCGR_PEP_ID=MMETSP0945-20130129/11497_1 /TAXON_ID=109269 /ORGANISM="Vaucheria litorea, Strain CCMP2940" /LENGTH=228 /DNA_ID=CAMNT_0011999007 /DNA_START=184 /DNA_END=866 /DNA_ORIENTATION=+
MIHMLITTNILLFASINLSLAFLPSIHNVVPTASNLRAKPLKFTQRPFSLQPVEGLDAGVVLIASPTDFGHFTQKSVALIYEYSNEATKAVVLDKGTPFTIGEMTSLNVGPLHENRLFRGGEDGGSSVVMIHGRHDIENSLRIGDTNLFVGGLTSAVKAVEEGRVQAEEFKFFFNFMRWSPGALEEQVAEGKWSTAFISDRCILSQSTKSDQELWPKMNRMLKEMGLV